MAIIDHGAARSCFKPEPVTADKRIYIPSLLSLSPPNFRLDPLPMLSLGSEGIPMLVSPAQPRFPPPQHHRRRRANGWPASTASLPVEPIKPQLASSPKLLRRGCRNQFPKRSHFPSQSEQNVASYLSGRKPVLYPSTPGFSERFYTMAVRLLNSLLVLLNKGNRKLKESSKAIVENLLNRGISRNGSGKYGDAPPLRSELFSAEQMKQHGRTLAGLHKPTPGRAPDQLLARRAENESVLIGVHGLMTEAVAANRQITPAGEWLLDNFYLIEEQIRTAKRHLRKPYSRKLPRLLDGTSAGLPRVYDIAVEIIAHGDGRVDPESLASFVSAYQTAT